MLLSVPRWLAFHEAVGRLFGAEGMGATPAMDFNHAVFSMLLAVRRYLAALDIEARALGTVVI